MAYQNEKLVWEIPGIKAWRSAEPYHSMFGKDKAVFGNVDDDN